MFTREMGAKVGVRWSVGALGSRGMEALRLSIWGAWRIFGERALYTVFVRGRSAHDVQEAMEELPPGIAWVNSDDLVPPFILAHGGGAAETVEERFAPLRQYPGRFELSLDPGCILWELPEPIERWLVEQHGYRCILTQDASAKYGQFHEYCGPGHLSSAIRGLPPAFKYGATIRELLRERELMVGHRLRMSPDDALGLEIAAAVRLAEPLIVTEREVTVCSPFHPYLGTCGARFVGLHAEYAPWTECWERHRPELYRKVELVEATQCAHC